MGLIKDIKDIESISNNRFNITKEDLIGDLKGFSIGVVVRMLEETELQENVPNIKVFQKDLCAAAEEDGFDWDATADGYNFWDDIIEYEKFNIFYKRYPDYKKYDKQ